MIERGDRTPWPAGTVYRDGSPVACWFGVERILGSDAFVGFAMTRDHGGQVRHFILDPDRIDEIEDALAAGGRLPGNGARPWQSLETFAAGVHAVGGIERLAAGEPINDFHDIQFMFMEDMAAKRRAAGDILRGIADFVAGLDRETVDKARRRDTALPIPDGAWWGLDATFGRGAPMAKALKRWPYLERAVCLAFACHRDAFAEARDGGARLVVEVMSSKGVPVGWTARNLDAVHAAHAANVRSDTFRGDPSALDRDLEVAGLLPPTARPKPADMRSFLRCAPAVRSVSWVSGPQDLGRHLAVGRDWATFERRLAKACGAYNPARAVRDVEDMLSAFRRQILTPALQVHAMGGLPHLPGGPGRVAAARGAIRRDRAQSMLAAAALLSGRTLARVVEDSEAWHRGSHRILATLASLPGTLGKPPTWPAIFPDHVEGDLAVVVLTDEGALADEGRHGVNADGTNGLNHCVGGYVSECLVQGFRILSLRRNLPGGGFERLSTAQIGVLDGNVVDHQHSGYENGAPPPEAAALLRRYLDELVRGGPYDEGTIPKLSPRGTDPCLTAGYDWFVPGNLEAAAAAWAPHVPRLLRSMTPSDWAVFEAWATKDGLAAWRRLPFRPSPSHVGELSR